MHGQGVYSNMLDVIPEVQPQPRRLFRIYSLPEKNDFYYLGDTLAAGENKMADVRHFQIW